MSAPEQPNTELTPEGRRKLARFHVEQFRKKCLRIEALVAEIEELVAKLPNADQPDLEGRRESYQEDVTYPATTIAELAEGMTTDVNELVQAIATLPEDDAEVQTLLLEVQELQDQVDAALERYKRTSTVVRQKRDPD